MLQVLLLLLQALQVFLLLGLLLPLPLQVLLDQVVLLLLQVLRVLLLLHVL